MATRLSFSPAEKLSARSPRDGPRSARLQSRTPAKDKPGRQSFRESPGAFRTAERLAEPTEPQTRPPAATSRGPAEAEMSAQAAEAEAQAAEISRHREQVLTAAQKSGLFGGGTARPPRTDPPGACSLRAPEDSRAAQTSGCVYGATTCTALEFFCRAFSTQVLRTDYSLALLERQLGQPRAAFLAQPELHWSVKGLRDQHAPG